MNVSVVDEGTSTPDACSRLPELDGHADGFAVLEALKRRRPGARAVVITAYDVVETSLRAAARGADDFPAKPLSWADLRQAIDGAVPHNVTRTAE